MTDRAHPPRGRPAGNRAAATGTLTAPAGLPVGRLRAGAPAGSGAVSEVLSTFTIADFLALDVTAAGEPAVVAGRRYLNRRIRWIHVTELANTQGLLQGGELILATGIALPSLPEEMTQYVDSMADQGVAGLVIELGRRFSAAPPAMVRACNRRRLPLVELRREVPFVKITEVAHSVILDGQRRLLQMTAAAHERFTELTSDDASIEELVAAAGELAEGRLVLSNLMHQVLAVWTPDGSDAELMRRWRAKALGLARVFGTQVDAEDGSVVTPVEFRGQQRGRLALFTPEAPDPAQVMIAERAAAALAMRLHLESDEVVAANAQRTLLADILNGRSGSSEVLHARAAALGHPTRDRYYLPITVLAERPDVCDLIVRALDEVRMDGIVGRMSPDRVGCLLLLRSDQLGPEEAFAARLATLCRQEGLDRPVVARGGLVGDLGYVRRSFAEAKDVAWASWAERRVHPDKCLYSADDVQLRGLLFTLRHDQRVQAFVERTLGPLLLRDAADGGDWVRTLAVYLRFRGNKSLTAQELGISRPTLYERLARMQRLLHLDLDDPEWSTSLYAAIMLAEATAPEGQAQFLAPRRPAVARPISAVVDTLAATDGRT